LKEKGVEHNTVKTSLLWASVATATIGFIFYNVMPLYLGLLQEATGLSSSQIGLVASAFFFGFNVTSFSSYYWVRTVPPFQAALTGTLVMIAGLWFADYSSSLVYQLLIAGAIGGISGAVGSIGVTIAGDAKNCTRWYGIQVAAAALAGVILLFILPVTLIPEYGFAGLIYGMIIMILLLLPVCFYLTKKPLPATQTDLASIDESTLENKSKINAWKALIAMTFLFIGSAAVWAFVERIAAINAFDSEAVGRLLGYSLFFSVIGSLVAGAIGDRFGNRWPYALSCIILVVGIMAIALTKNLNIYAAGACLFMFGWAAAFAYLFAIIANVDPDGKHIALSVPAVGIGSMIGPGLAGFMLSGGSTNSLQIMCLITVAASMIFVCLSAQRSER
jgi:predicted MFS family arabinose efflux permease